MSNFRQYGQMVKQRWEESEKRQKEEQRKGRVKTKKMQMREKLEKSRSAAISNVSWLRRVEK